MENELNGFCTWDELSDAEIQFYTLKENDRELNMEIFKCPIVNQFDCRQR